MDEYTLTDNALRTFVVSMIALSTSPDEAEAVYNRWLAAHDRAMKAEALREACRAVPSGEMWPDATNPSHFAQKWLLSRADQIEKGATE